MTESRTSHGGAPGGSADPGHSPAAAVTRRLVRLNLIAAVAFTLGGSLFALGAVLAQLGSVSLTTVNITYLVGGCFFSLGGYASILLVTKTSDAGGWWSATVLFVGTLLFAVSLVAAFAEGLTPRQSNGWIWLPDILGCVCFLVSGHLALTGVGGWRIRERADGLDWWVAVVNQSGSILFFLAGIAAFTRPTTSTAIDIGLVNWGTFAGAICFAIGGVVQMLDKPTPGNQETGARS
jgi:hypothetical protein